MLVLFVIISVFTVVLMAVAKWLIRWAGPAGAGRRDYREPEG